MAARSGRTGAGISDPAEFVAGTNPTNTSSALQLTVAFQPVNGSMKMSWPSGAGHAYRVHGSADGVTWAPNSEWIRATGPTTSWTVTPRTNGAPYLFRIEAKP